MLKTILPDDIEIIIIGDGEFNGIEFLETMEDYGWFFVVRTDKNSKFSQRGYAFRLPKRLAPGDYQSGGDIHFTDELYGPVRALAWKPDAGGDVIYLVSNCQPALMMKQCYKKRQQIETFFSDLNGLCNYTCKFAG